MGIKGCSKVVKNYKIILKDLVKQLLSKGPNTTTTTYYKLEGIKTENPESAVVMRQLVI
jgi:hypothetical protein